MNAEKLRALFFGLLVVVLAGCAVQPQQATASKGPNIDELKAALAAPTRSQADRDRDADRKPAQLMSFLGVQPGMTAIDILAAGGYVTEVLSIAVGPKGKVYAQNPQMLLKMRDGVNDKALAARVANNRLPNVVRVDSDLPNPLVPPGSVDVAITVMNLHDVYNSMGAATALTFMKDIYSVLKPGGVFGVIDHVGVDGADNTKMHRMAKHLAVDVAKSVGFVVEAESDVLANPADDHSKGVFDPTLRGKTDQFVLRLRKPK